MVSKLTYASRPGLVGYESALRFEPAPPALRGRRRPWHNLTGGFGVSKHPGAVVDPLRKRAKMVLGLVVNNLQLNNSLINSNFRYFTFFGEYQNAPPLIF